MQSLTCYNARMSWFSDIYSAMHSLFGWLTLREYAGVGVMTRPNPCVHVCLFLLDLCGRSLALLFFCFVAFYQYEYFFVGDCSPGRYDQEFPVDTKLSHVEGEKYYNHFHGVHRQHLRRVYEKLRKRENESIIFLAGDSSLDNKYWITEKSPATRGYRDVLYPPTMKQDVTYWINRECELRDMPYTCITTAVEATTLHHRRPEEPSMYQDKFIREHISNDDVLVVSVGGNDIALYPSTRTVISLAMIAYLWPSSWVRDGWAPGMAHVRSIFKDDTERYVSTLIGDKKPRAVIVCMIYHPDTNAESYSWASSTLGILGYDASPSTLHTAIASMYRDATCAIRIPGVRIVPLALGQSAVMDGSNTAHYEQRVEPSSEGGHRMASAFLDSLAKSTQ